jgi:flagellar biosynthesis protein FlhF
MAAEIVESLNKSFPLSESRRNSFSLHQAISDSQLEAELSGRFQVDPGLAVDRDQAQTVVLVGPPGAGKTSTLVKLALRYGLHARRGMHLISMDTMRIGAAGQLRCYASILGVSFQAVETGRALAQALEEHRNKSLVLVDTGGYSSSNLVDAADLAICLSEHPEVDTHLVVPASMKSSDLERTVRAFEIFGPSKLLFTRLDETDSLGSLFCVAARTGKAISFLCTGQSIPEDLEPATKERILQPILEFEAERSEAAA